MQRLSLQSVVALKLGPENGLGFWDRRRRVALATFGPLLAHLWGGGVQGPA